MNKPQFTFKNYQQIDEKACLKLFDDNCPLYFAENERADYQHFLQSQPADYQVCLINNEVVGAFGLLPNSDESDEKPPVSKRINWILICSKAQGLGIGHLFMQSAISQATKEGIEYINIAASHLSAPFFSKYGAKTILETHDGWGKDMHKVDMKLYL
ncbi:GNAT family N-acetyltransferase [Shewanella sp. TC10]|uniref:GNAT family N-acetyltransferase n=1 Tax=Shewanella sp. TC10 TaxID=1419739 RepID=UPI00129D701C|nr:GNAT family N-acetyltransferase [Shewanella sp. TC10]